MQIVDKSPIVKYTAEKCRELRKIKSLSQHDLTVDTGLNIGRIELGNQDVSISTIYRLCEYFGVSVAKFYEGFDSVEITNPE